MSQKQRFFNLTFIIVVICITALFVVSAVAQKQSDSVGGDNVKTVLFSDANTAMKVAEDANADILAPKNFDVAVKQYFLANTDLNESRITVIGYGESKPIASNETRDGRATNRRVEVVIHP